MTAAEGARARAEYTALAGRVAGGDPLADVLDDWVPVWARWYQRGLQAKVRTVLDGDPGARQDFAGIVQHLLPALQDGERDLYDALLARSGELGSLPEAFRPFVAHVEEARRLQHPANVALTARTEVVGQRYQRLRRTWEGEHDGFSIGLGPYREVLGNAAERGLRRATFRARADRRRADLESCEQLFGELLEIRSSMSSNLGFVDYREVAHRELRRELTSERAQRFHEAVEVVVAPALKRLYDERLAELGLDSLRPWDLRFAPAAEAPWSDGSGLIEVAAELMGALDPDLARHFGVLRPRLDVASGSGRGGRSFSAFLPVDELPLVVVSTTGSRSDLFTLLHELGHALHDTLRAPATRMPMVRPGHDVCELASIAHEVLHHQTLHTVFGDVAQRMIRSHWLRLLLLTCEVAAADRFQQWVYASGCTDPKAWHDRWLSEIQRLLGPLVVDEEDALRVATMWLDIPHLVLMPMYALEYGLAAVGALGIERAQRRQPRRAVQDYMAALSLPGGCGASTFYELAGTRYAPDAAWVSEAIADLGL